MTHRGPFQPLLFCDSVILSLPTAVLFGFPYFIGGVFFFPPPPKVASSLCVYRVGLEPPGLCGQLHCAVPCLRPGSAAC